MAILAIFDYLLDNRDETLLSAQGEHSLENKEAYILIVLFDYLVRLFFWVVIEDFEHSLCSLAAVQKCRDFAFVVELAQEFIKRDQILV